MDTTAIEAEYREYLQSVGMPFLVDDMIAGLLSKNPRLRGDDVAKFLMEFVNKGESDRFQQALNQSRASSHSGGAAGRPGKQKAYINRDLQEMGGGKINWRKVASTMPTSRSEEDKKKRDEIWRLIDMNGNGYVSLAELDKGMRDIMKLDEVFHCKPVMMRAFQRAKNVHKTSKAKLGEDFITKCEFRALLVFLKRYFELFVVFDAIDADDDRRLTEEEFSHATEALKKWGLKVSFPAAQFKQLDRNGGGIVLFDEFCEWAIANRLDIENDDELDDYSDELWAGTEGVMAPVQEAIVQGRGKAAGRGAGGRGRNMRQKAARPGAAAEPESPDWFAIAAKIPADRTATADVVKRAELWTLVDTSKKNYVTLAELDKGLSVAFGLPRGFSCEPACRRAFTAAKAANPNTRAKAGQEIVSFSEFRVLLEDLKRVFEVYAQVDGITLDDDGRLNLEEFKNWQETLEGWGLPKFNPEAEFKSILRGHGNKISMADVAAWAVEKKIQTEGTTDPL